MPTCCCVPNCSNRGGHVFPTDDERRKKWIIAIKRDKWNPTQTSRVCKAHFKKDDYISHTVYGKYPIFFA